MKKQKSLSSGFIYNEDKKIFRNFEIFGVIFIFLSACLLHFCYRWSNGAMWSMLIGAVNESVWEHVKIFILPYLFWAIIELCILVPPFHAFVCAKVFGVYFFIIITIFSFYFYTYFSRTPILIIDIVNSVICVFIANMVSYTLTLKIKNNSKLFNISMLLLMLLFFMYITFTFFPPQLDLFQDPLTGTYGIPRKTLSYKNYVNAKNV